MEADFPRKLGLKAGQQVYLMNSPQGFREEMAQAAPQVVLGADVDREPVDMVVAWPEGGLVDIFQRLLPALKPDGAIWVVIPKKASGARGPSFQSVLEAALPLGLVDNKTLGFSATEYGIRLVTRRELR